MTVAKLSSKNQMVLPREAREHLGVGAGDEILVVPKGAGVILMAKPSDVLEALRGSGRGVYGPVRRYLRGERRSWALKKSNKR